MVNLHVCLAFRDVSLCRPADNISRQFVRRSGPPIRLYMSRDMRFPTMWYVLPAKAHTRSLISAFACRLNII